jgi:hypothetical protein
MATAGPKSNPDNAASLRLELWFHSTMPVGKLWHAARAFIAIPNVSS